MNTVSFGRQDPFEHKCRGCGTYPSIVCDQRAETISHKQRWPENTRLNTAQSAMHMHARLKLRWLPDPVINHCVTHSPQTLWKDQINTNGFLKRKVFSDEATFYVSGTVNGHNVKNWGSESLHALLVYPHPVCQRTLPVSVSVLCHSRIDGLLGNLFRCSIQ
jgi:hypothetical protein